MELSFIIKSLGRFWWVALACAALIFTPVYVAKGGTTTNYVSEAVLLVSPPGASTVPTVSSSDRYVARQVSVLQSATVAEAVAGRVGATGDAGSIARSVEVMATPATDIVTIVVTGGSPERAQEIATAYVDGYSDLLEQHLVELTDRRDGATRRAADRA